MDPAAQVGGAGMAGVVMQRGPELPFNCVWPALQGPAVRVELVARGAQLIPLEEPELATTYWPAGQAAAGAVFVDVTDVQVLVPVFEL